MLVAVAAMKAEASRITPLGWELVEAEPEPEPQATDELDELDEPLSQPDTVFDVVFSDEGPLGIRFVEAEATSQLDGEATTFLVIGEVRPGSYAARIAPQLREGLMLKAVNGTDVGDTSGLASERVYELLRQRPVSLSFIQLDQFGTFEVDDV